MTQDNAKRRKMFFEALDKSKIKYKTGKLTKKKYNEEMNREIEVGDLMLIDISPDDCGGIVVPRIAETQAELDEFINKMQNGEYILEGILTKEQIQNQVYWLGLDKEEKQ